MGGLGRALARATLVVVAALVAVATGCSSDPGKPTALPSLTDSPTPVAVSTTTPETVTARWFNLIQRPTALATADEMDRITTADCKCRRASASIRTAVRKHQSYFGIIRVRSLRESERTTHYAAILVTYDQQRGGLRDEAGHVISIVPAHTDVNVIVRLAFVRQGWLITEIATLSNGQAA